MSSGVRFSSRVRSLHPSCVDSALNLEWPTSLSWYKQSIVHLQAPVLHSNDTKSPNIDVSYLTSFPVTIGSRGSLRAAARSDLASTLRLLDPAQRATSVVYNARSMRYHHECDLLLSAHLSARQCFRTFCRKPSILNM